MRLAQFGAAGAAPHLRLRDPWEAPGRGLLLVSLLPSGPPRCRDHRPPGPETGSPSAVQVSGLRGAGAERPARRMVPVHPGGAAMGLPLRSTQLSRPPVHTHSGHWPVGLLWAQVSVGAAPRSRAAPPGAAQSRGPVPRAGPRRALASGRAAAQPHDVTALSRPRGRFVRSIISTAPWGSGPELLICLRARTRGP